jgi:hypothetical protein
MQKSLSAGTAVFLGLFLAVSAAGYAREMKGVTFPDTETIGNATVNLAGIGLRKKLVINVYLGALYLEKSATGAPEVISSDQPKRVVLHFLYNHVGPDDLTKAWNEGFRNNVPDRIPALKDRIATFIGFFTEPVKSGEKIVVTYLPGTGTEVSIKGKVKGTIPGRDFMEALVSVWFGKNPPSGDLKKGMLGEK